MVPLPTQTDSNSGFTTVRRKKVKIGSKGSSKVASLLKAKAKSGPSRDLLMKQREDDADAAADLDEENIGSVAEPTPIVNDDEDDEIMIDTTTVVVPPTAIIMGDDTPVFAPLKASAAPKSEKREAEARVVPIPPHRMSPLKKEWVNIFTPLTEMLGLQVRMNTKKRAVEMRTSKFTKEVGAIQKGADYVKAFALGFLISDAIALLRLDDLYLDSFEIKDVKTLSGDHLSRAIGRIAGQDGKTKFTIENATRTRIILADTKIHIMGSFQNIRLAKDAIVNLILGSPPGKVYASLRTVASRLKQRAI